QMASSSFAASVERGHKTALTKTRQGRRALQSRAHVVRRSGAPQGERLVVSVRSVAYVGLLILCPAETTRAEEVGDRALLAYEIVDGFSIPSSLTGKPGNPKEGRRIVINRQLGNCLTCHRMPIPEEPDHGDVATDLQGAGARWSEGELRL